MTKFMPLLVLITAVAVSGCSSMPETGSSAAFACKNYQTQPEAQKAWESAGSPKKNDSDGDGVVCTSLSKASSASSSSATGAKTENCKLEQAVKIITVSRAKYPETSLHIEKSIDMGQPGTLTIERSGTDQKRNEWHKVINKGWDYDQDGQTDDMDEWPMAFTGEGGRNANIALVNPSDNRGAGSSIAGQLRNYCDGQKFNIKFFGSRPSLTRILIVADNGKRVNIEAGN